MKTAFFDRPAKALSVLIAVLAVVWSLQCALCQTVLGKDVVETVMWGAQWQWGHLKHPPLSGWIGYLVAVVSGYSDFAMYFAAQLFLAIGAFYVYRLGRLFLDETESAAGVLLLYLLFYYNPSSMKFCSHFVEAAFMPAMAFYIIRGARENRLSDWLLAGFFTALGMLGKYSAGVILPACLIYILADRERRKCLVKPWLWCGVVLGVLLLLPHLIWLAENDFCCLRHVERRVSDDTMPWYYFLEVAAVGIGPVLAEWAILWAAWLPCRKDSMRKTLPRELVLASLLLTLVPAAVFTVIALSGGDVVLMWYSFLAGWTGLAAVGLFPMQISRKIFRNLWVLAVAYSVIMLVASTVDILKKSRLRCHADPAKIVKTVESFYQKKNPGGKLPCIIGERWICGVVQFYSPEHPHAFSESDPVSLKPVRARIEREGAVLLGDPGKIRKWHPDLAKDVKFEYIEVEYQAPFGKLKTDEYYIALYPGKGKK
ncbi:MAG: glycosyltransferase family 39 protein [Lentisphaerae bacterium]|nr:glycosyltransferase family 39 protein [Lentisphaerota bacterium]